MSHSGRPSPEIISLSNIGGLSGRAPGSGSLISKHSGAFGGLKKSPAKNSPQQAGSSDYTSEESSQTTQSSHKCWAVFGKIYSEFIPSRTPVLMYITLCIVTLISIFTKAAQGVKPSISFYGIYLGLSLGILFIFLSARLVWVLLFNPFIYTPSFSFVFACLSVLDPAVIYLAYTICLKVFWEQAIIEQVIELPALRVLQPTTTSPPSFRIQLSILGMRAFTDAILNILMFFFLVGFLMNVNPILVKYLTRYSLLRKLNANWIRLTPAREKMALERKSTLDTFEEDFPPFNTQSTLLSSGNKIGARQDTTAPTEDANVMTDLKITDAADVVENLLAVEAAVKEKKLTGSVESVKQSVLHLPTVYQRSAKKNVRQAYHIEFTGKNLPTFIHPEKIHLTQSSQLTNMLAVQQSQESPAVLFVRGIRVEILSKRIARLAGKYLFEELIEFRNLFAPIEDEKGAQPLTTAQIDQHVKQSVINVVESAFQETLNIPSPAASHSPLTGDLETHSSLREPCSPHPGAPSSPINEPHSPRLKHETTPDVSPILSPSHSQQVIITKDTSSPPIQKQTSNTAEPPAPSLIAPLASLPEYQINISKPQTDLSPTSTNKIDPITESIADSDSEAPGEKPSLQYKKDPIYGAEPGSLPVPTGPVVHFTREVNVESKDPRSFLSREIFELFLGDQIEEFMKIADPGGRDKVGRKEFTRMVVELYVYRKELISLLESQESIHEVFKRMLSFFLSFIALLVFLIVLGVSAETIVISGAAALSSVTVALSFLYSGFIQSVLFVCFLNPYSVGDRCRLGVAQDMHVVNRISTYFTEFLDVLGRPVFWNHSVLYGMNIVNESRNRHAGIEVIFRVAQDTPPEKYEALHHAVEHFVDSTSNYIKGSFACIMTEVEISHFVRFTYWITCVESWHQWQSTWNSRALIIKLIARQCKQLGITYRLPVQRVSLNNWDIDKPKLNDF